MDCPNPIEPLTVSIAGYQDKIAIYEREGRWYLVDGGRLASTEIVKPVPIRKQLATLPANEHLCMQLARRIGLEAAQTRLVQVPESVLLVRRFDRVETEAGVRRLHIVDGCQALGLAVSMKHYERAYGDTAEVAHLREGASLPKLFSLVDQSPLPAVDRIGLLRWVIFQVLIGNTDAHGKNVSFLCDGRGLRLAPAYDMVCMGALDAGFLAYLRDGHRRCLQRRRAESVRVGAFRASLKAPFRLVAHELEKMAGQVISMMDSFLADMIGQSVPMAVAQRFQDLVLATCIRQCGHVQQIARFKRTDFE